ncbi:MAG: ribbon-helix-helix protein, CopG family [Euryarchaeota archaeon]|nr:ribbon-helix-helix protein, CopG family [Euryarchaeota archaeon]MDE1836578.1 ribbon-helix-helix protein, CopG family [Euryarchaeota archaeon]MDE1879227.1 ribbon-helix-helix protein, CopG family [Euryarchaeota archaeon]MDE2044548.1 ribbon-helix-helix protein, CopG family [Thermoplasmata archaeon]
MSNLRTKRVEVRLSEDEDGALDRLAQRWRCDRAEAIRRAFISFDTNGSHIVSVPLDAYDLGVASTLARRWNVDEGGAVRKAFHAFSGLMEMGLANVIDQRKMDFLARAVDDPSIDVPRKRQPTRHH